MEIFSTNTKVIQTATTTTYKMSRKSLLHMFEKKVSAPQIVQHVKGVT